MKITRKEFEAVKEEIKDLIYKSPRCDFEHIWNTAIDKAGECFNGFGDEE